MNTILQSNLFQRKRIRFADSHFFTGSCYRRAFYTGVARKGFILIELVVVVAIIAVIMAILVPSLQTALRQAMSAVCQTRLKHQGTGYELYAADNDGRLSFPVRAVDYLLCPMAAKLGTRRDPSNPNSAPGLGSAFEAWNSAHGPYGSYGVNDAMGGREFPRPAYNIFRGGLPIYEVKGQFNYPVVLDSASPYITSIWKGEPPAPSEANETSCCINRHNEAVNCLFLDWSVRKVGLKELWKLKWYSDFDTNGPWTKAGGVKPEDWPEWMRGFKDY